jgi:hypothetical protein
MNELIPEIELFFVRIALLYYYSLSSLLLVCATSLATNISAKESDGPQGFSCDSPESLSYAISLRPHTLAAEGLIH